MIRKWWIAVAAVAVAVAALSVAANANLTGSTFESTDGNMVVNTPGNEDWINAPHLHVGTDVATGQNDNSFGQGTQENDVNVTVVTGSIPNSKADLGKFADASETLPNGDVMLYLAWTRNNLSGTTNFDFELNKAPQPNLTTAGAKTLNRTAGDVLVNYALQGGSQTPTLTRRTWLGSVWGPETAFSASVADGSTNTAAAVQNTLGGGGNIPAAEFGEAAINMTAAGLIANQNDPNAPCTGFGSAYVKSRSSSSFTSEIKDFIAPITLDLNTCGHIVIKKVTDPATDTTTSFPFTVTGPNTNDSFSLTNGGSHNVVNATPDTNLKAGTYNAAEGAVAGWNLDPANTSCDDGSPVNAISLQAGETVTCTFKNIARGTITIVKQTDPDGSPQFFTFHPSYGSAFQLSDGQSNDSVPLVPGTYSVSEDEPAGWRAFPPPGSSCSDGSPVTAISLQAGEHVTCTFTNQQLGNIIVHKVTNPAGTPGSFNFTADYSASGFALSDGQSNDSGPIAPGSHSVSENVPANWTMTSSCDNGNDPSAITLLAGQTVNCTFTNTPHGSITVTKLHKHAADGPGDHPEAGVNFTVNGVTKATGADGTVCFDGLTFGSYVVHETVPAGESNAANDQSVVVNAVAGCPGGAAGNTITYHNVPLTDIHVSAHSQMPGGTVTNIDCGAIGTDNGGDPHVDALSLAPGTYTCTIVVDP